MNAQEQISRLQGLLTRIQRNAARPRAAVAPTAEVAVAPAPQVSPQPSAAVATSALDQSVDDLLGSVPEPSPAPVEVEVTLESVPPDAEIAATVEVASVEIASVEVAAALEPAIEAESHDEPEPEPIPLVAASPHPEPTPPPADEFSLESEVSEVRMANLAREPGPEVTVAAIEAEAEPIAPEELSEDDLVEVAEAAAAPSVSVEVDIDFEDEEEEQAPASSQRSRVASNLDEALAAAAAQLESEHEAPLKTPPPESGPQEAPLPPQIASPAAPDVDALLGSEVDIPSRAVAVPSEGPTAEQLGQTIDLEEARGPSLELAEAKLEEAAAPGAMAGAVEELEVALPGPSVAGSYDAALQPPPEAQQELAAHLQRQVDDIPPPPESLAQYPSVQPAAAEATPAIALVPESVARPIPTTSPEAFVSVREAFRPSSFVELLDASLGLNAD